MKSKYVATCLRTAMDPSRSIRTQEFERYVALLQHYGIQPDTANRDLELALALARDQFPKAFEIRCSGQDPRRKIHDVRLLQEVVGAINAGDMNSVPLNHRKLAQDVTRWLSSRGKLTNVQNICHAISKVATNEWRAISPATLRDNILRPSGEPGARRKRKSDRIWEGLQHSIDEIKTMKDDVDIEP